MVKCWGEDLTWAYLILMFTSVDCDKLSHFLKHISHCLFSETNQLVVRGGEMLEGINTFSFIAVFNGQFFAKLPSALLEYLNLKLLINTSYNSGREYIHLD